MPKCYVTITDTAGIYQFPPQKNLANPNELRMKLLQNLTQDVSCSLFYYEHLRRA